MKIKKGNRRIVMWMLCAFFAGVLFSDVSAYAATSGTIPCSEGSVSWTLNDSGELVFSGNGTTDIVNGVCSYGDPNGGSWSVYWRDNNVEKENVVSIRVEEGSSIRLDTAVDMFLDFKNCTSINMTGFDTSQVACMLNMFSGCIKLTDLNIRNMDTSNVTDMSSMFSSCLELPNIDVTGFNTQNVTNMESMFNGCSSLINVDVTGFNTQNVTNMCAMFGSCCKLRTLDLSSFNTSKVTNMEGMFYYCKTLESVNVSSFDTRAVTDMYEMFRNCEALKMLDLSSFSTPNVTNMGLMFLSCNSLTTINVSNFDTKNVTSMAFMFKDCQALQALDVSNFDTSKVITMREMFYNCKSLTSLDLSSFRTEALVNILDMFQNCESLESLDISSFDTSQIKSLDWVFWGCKSLKELDLSGFAISEDTTVTLRNCDSLEKLTAAKTEMSFKIESDADEWFDDARNIYSEEEMITLAPGTTIYRVKDAFNIHYIYEGKLIDCPTTYVVANGLDKLGTVELDYHTFGGWYEDENYTKPITSIPKGNLGDVTLYAKMTPNTYTITYMNLEKANSTENMLSEYTYGSTHALPTLKSTLYLFEGWYLDSGFTTKIESIIPTTNGNLTLYAKWTPVFALPESILKITDETILSMPDDSDVEGSSFALIQARTDKIKKNSIRLQWNKVENADGYKVYGNKCGKKNRMQLLTKIENGQKTSYTQKKLKKGTYYKYIVRAYKLVDGQEVTLAVSKTLHATTKGGKYGVAKSVKIKKDKKMKSKKGAYTLTIKQNKKYTIKASEVKESKKIKRHRKLAYESSDTTIATVSQKGVVKGITKGSCNIYVYAQNGVYKKIKVKVQ